MPSLTIPDEKIRTLYQDAFPLCTDMSLMATANGGAYSPLLDFFRLQPSESDEYYVGAVSYIGPEGTSATPDIVPWVDDTCAPRLGVESGNCTLKFKGWGNLGVKTTTRDIYDYNTRKCDREPTYLFGGVQIQDELQWDLIRGARTLMDGLHKGIVVGNKGSSVSQFDGLERLVNNNYIDSETGERCTSQDSMVINYNNNVACPADANPPSGVTWNGVAKSPQSLTHVIEEVVRNISARVSMSGVGGLQTGNVLILAPGAAINSIIDCYICSRYCNNNPEGLKNNEAREWYDRIINAGGFGSGVLNFGNVQVPILPYDYGLIKSATAFDIYVLTNGAGNTPFTYLQYKDARLAEAAARRNGDASVKASDMGKVLVSKAANEGTCTYFNMDMRTRLVIRAPWAQARIQNIAYSGLAPIYSMDPTSEFFVETNKVAHPELVTP